MSDDAAPLHSVRAASDQHPRVALVTGAGSGLGAAIARRLHRDGFTVAINDIDPRAAHGVASELEGRSFPFDVTDSVAFETAVESIVEEFGHLDVLVNNAGIAGIPDEDRTRIVIENHIARAEGRIDDLIPPNFVVDTSDTDFDRMISVHLYGTFHGVRAALRHMTPRRSGSIVNLGSILALRPQAGPFHYSAAKAAIVALTRSVGQEMAPFGVRVNAICPGWADTPLLAPADDIVRAGIVAQIPQGRMAQADEIAGLAAFLASPDASYCSGEIFTVSGGVV